MDRVTTRYDESMTTKITVSLPDELVEDARRAVKRGDAASVSAYVAAAMRSVRPKLPAKEVFDAWWAESGPPSVEDYAWAEEQLARMRAKAKK